MFKMFFRSFDYDWSKSLKVDEFVAYSTYCGYPIKKTQAKRLIRKHNPDGKKQSLTFTQMYKEITGQSIDSDVDPYDGQVP
jgi:Ca2+-binding EF-hand superfamily protein